MEETSPPNPALRPPAVRLENVRVTYQRGRVTVDAVKGIDLEIPAGDFLAIEGPSGSGKSTLLRAMAGLWPTTSGRVWIEGIPLDQRSDSELAILRRRRIGFLHQLFNLLPDLTAGENVALPLLLADEPTGNLDEKTGNEIMELFDRLVAAGQTMILVTHNPAYKDRVQRVLRMHDGRVESDGPVTV